MNATQYRKRTLPRLRCFDRRSLTVAPRSPARYLRDVGKGRLGLVSPSPFGNESSGLWLRAADPHERTKDALRASAVRPRGSRFRKRSVEHRLGARHDVSQTQYDTIIAGAGPVGLFLACELSLAGLLCAGPRTGDDPSSPLKRAPVRTARPLSSNDREPRPTRPVERDRGLRGNPRHAGDGALDEAAPPSGRPLRRHPVLP